MRMPLFEERLTALEKERTQIKQQLATDKPQPPLPWKDDKNEPNQREGETLVWQL